MHLCKTQNKNVAVNVDVDVKMLYEPRSQNIYFLHDTKSGNTFEDYLRGTQYMRRSRRSRIESILINLMLSRLLDHSFHLCYDGIFIRKRRWTRPKISCYQVGCRTIGNNLSDSDARIILLQVSNQRFIDFM